MPGPMSTPAGMKANVNNFSPRDPNKRIYTGKTDQAKGKIKNAKNEGAIRKLSRARRAEQEQD